MDLRLLVAPAYDGEQIAALIPLTPHSELRFYASKFRGRWVTQARRWVNSPKFRGYSRQGLSIPPTRLLPLADTITNAAGCGEPERDVCPGRIQLSANRELVARARPSRSRGPRLDVRVFVDAPSFVGWLRDGFNVPLREWRTVASALQRLSALHARIATAPPRLW